MRLKPNASAVVCALVCMAICLGSCNGGRSDDAPGATTLNREQARLQALLDRSVFTLEREAASLHLVTTACFTRPGTQPITDFRLQPGQTFTSEPDHHINTVFALQELRADHARFTYVHHHAPPGPASDRSTDHGEIVLPYRQRRLFFPKSAEAPAAAIEALRRAGALLTELDLDRATVYLDRESCASWRVRFPRSVSAQPAKGGAWNVWLDMATGKSMAIGDD